MFFLKKYKNEASPFLKWAGGKSQILGEIRQKYPEGLGVSVTKYAEPFIGGGAVLFDVLNNYTLKNVYISDINHELINTYISIRDNVSDLIKILGELESQYLSKDEEGRKKEYYLNRTRFNALKAESSDSVELAALFIALNHTCFNGLYRVNSKGNFNVPQGSYKNPKICDRKNLIAVSSALKDVEIVWGNYKLSKSFIDENTFAYFDPPYRPLNSTSNFTSYAQDGFGDKEQIELARFIDLMSECGSFIIASNSDPTNFDPKDDFFDKLYSKHSIKRIDATRAINSIGVNRGCVRELLIVTE
ncbi:MAG: Dam family site-specific DNA-(adenine-N6)-methyltransferase [Deltaproteobacteria bacterium]|jgi:DNA adenine methylase|nr:Dam family site-specific DNA-(adenine-N6)-methyltransferase [Deltaproteobacteria bacterium]